MVCSPPLIFLCKGSSISWVTKLKGDKKFGMQTVKWVVVKLYGDKHRFFLQEMSSREVTGRQTGIPIFHETLRPMHFCALAAFPDLEDPELLKLRSLDSSLRLLNRSSILMRL